MMNTIDTATLVSLVRRYARKHEFEDGWDIVVNTYTDDMIAGVVAGAPTGSAAIDQVRATLSPIAA